MTGWPEGDENKSSDSHNCGYCEGCEVSDKAWGHSEKRKKFLFVGEGGLQGWTRGKPVETVSERAAAVYPVSTSCSW